MSALLEIDELTLDLPIDGELRRVLHGVSLAVGAGEAVGLIGESGSGKSMTVRSALRVLPPGARPGGALRYDGVDVLTMGNEPLRAYRADEVAMIYQDPRAHINPVRRIRDFLIEGMAAGRRVGSQGDQRAADLLAEVGIADPRRVLRQYPHELSGGMLQRVMIAGALAAEPKLMLADEPTTALDVTRQAEVIAILNRLRRDRGLALLFVTHDLELAAAMCDRICVMYAGSIVEVLPVSRLHQARHPYTRALLAARPDVGSRRRLAAIPGRPISGFEVEGGCAFAARCAHVVDACRTQEQVLRPVGDGMVRCHRAEELEGESA